MPTRRRRSLREAIREHQSALKDLQNEVNLSQPDEIPAAAQRERDAHHRLERLRQRSNG
jgi:Sec-independent protein translocase protein TatA